MFASGTDSLHVVSNTLFFIFVARLRGNKIDGECIVNDTVYLVVKKGRKLGVCNSLAASVLLQYFYAFDEPLLKGARFCEFLCNSFLASLQSEIAHDTQEQAAAE